MHAPLAHSLRTRIPALSPAVYTAMQVLFGSLFIALFAQISVPLPFSPVPVTGQTFAVLVVATALGSRNGLLAVAAYLAEGAAGLPFFAGGVGGPLVLVGPTGGYLLGFLLCAYVCGKFAELGFDRSYSRTLLTMSLGHLLIFVPGLLWLSRFVPVEQTVALGLLPFIPGTVLKTLAAAALFPPLRKKL